MWTITLNYIDFTEEENDPDDQLENSKDRCGPGAVGIFQGLVVLPGNLADVDNLLRCAGPVFLLHGVRSPCKITFLEDLLSARGKLFLNCSPLQME